LSERHSPLLDAPGQEYEVGHAPAPWALKQCAETGLVFLANPPPYEEFSEHYAYEVTHAREMAARRAAEPLRYAFSTAMKHFRARVLRRNKMLSLARSLLAAAAPGELHVLDVGCGWGALLEDLGTALAPAQRARYRPYGVEISRQLAHIASERLEKLGGACLHAPAAEGLARFGTLRFDVIIMASYLEHEIHPLPVLQRCRAQLKAGGSIVLKVPNYACWNRRLRGDRWCGFRWPDHVNYFTPATLRLAAKRAGLRIVRFDTNPLSDNMYAILRAPA